MASADEGYEDSRFESAVPHNFHCAICLNVLKQPMQCVRNEHSFCRPCIVRHLQEYERCPSCMEPLTLQTLRPSRLLTDLLSQLKIKCDNVERGCPDIVKLQMLQAHVANCGFVPVKCSNDGCEVIINRRDKLHHENNECNYRKGKCVSGEDVQRKLNCYVTRTEMDGVREEICSIKEIVTSMSRDLTRYMGDMNSQVADVKGQIGDMKDQIGGIEDQIGDMKDQIGDMKDQIGDVKDQDQIGGMKDQMGEMHRRMKDFRAQMGEIESEVQSLKQEPQSSICSVGSPVSGSEQNVNIRNDVIIAGGGSSLRSVEMFSWTTRQWTLLPPMTSEHWCSSSFVHQDRMFVCGGVLSGDSMEVLQLGEDGAQWKNFPAKLPQATYGHASVIYEDYLFIFGGYSGGKVVNDIHKVCLVSPLHSSQLVCRMPEPRAFHGAQRFGDKVIIVGGTTTGGLGGSLDAVLVYDITNNCCQTLAPLPYAVSDMATVAWKDNIILLGGLDKNSNDLNMVVSYNVKERNCKMLPSMKHKRSGCTAVVTGNVTIVMGGWVKRWWGKEARSQLNSVECFNFYNYAWGELPPMKEKRPGSTAAVKCGF